MAGHAWNRKGEPDRVVLEHARTLLLALAALVERAAGLPPVERLRFLAVLGCGEAEVRSIIIAMAYDAGSPTEVAAAPDLRPCTPAWRPPPAQACGNARQAARHRRAPWLAYKDEDRARRQPRSASRHRTPSR